MTPPFSTYSSPHDVGEVHIYADDSAIGTTGSTFQAIQTTLEGLGLTYTSCEVLLYLTSKDGRRASLLSLPSGKQDNKTMKFEREPMYLGVTLDRPLTFAPHAKVVEKKQRIGRASLGSSPERCKLHYTAHVSLDSSATAEYATPAWAHSKHIKAIDTTINNVLRIISSTITPTPVVTRIPPAHLRRDYLTLKLT